MSSGSSSSAPAPGFTRIRDLKPGLKNVNLDLMLLEMLGKNQTKDGDIVWVFKAADCTAAINFAIIGDSGQLLKPGDICRIKNGFSSVFKGALTFYVGKSGELKKIGEFCFTICEEPYMSFFKPPPPKADMTSSPPVRQGSSGSLPKTEKHRPPPVPSPFIFSSRSSEDDTGKALSESSSNASPSSPEM